MADRGILARKNGSTEARIKRHLAHEPRRVWTMLTAPDRLAEWLAPGTIDTRIGGRAKLNFVDSGIVIDSKVTACEPNKTLAYAWGRTGDPLRPIRWDLSNHGFETTLTLTLGIPDGEDVARSCAGWEAHLEMLEAALEGVPIRFPFERFKASREAYNAMLASTRANASANAAASTNA